MKSNKEQATYNTVTELLRHSFEGREHLNVFVQEDGADGIPVSFGQFKSDLLKLAKVIKNMDAKHIGIVCDLTYDCVLCMYSIVLAGKVLVPLESDMKAEKLDTYINKADVDLLLYHEEHIDGIVSSCKTMLYSDLIEMKQDELEEWPEWEEDRVACIVFSSGTEGKINGAVLTQKNLSLIKSHADSRPLRSQPKTLIFLPIHHILSFVSITVCIVDGCEIHLSRNIQYVSQEMAKIRPDILMTVPTVNELFRQSVMRGIEKSGKKKQIDGLIRFSRFLMKLGIDLRTQLFKKVRESMGGIPQLIVTGGAASNNETISYFADFGILIVQAYGLTETSATVSANTVKYNRIGSSGRVLPFVDVRIKDGEIQVRGANIMKEYYKDAEQTAKVFEDGWFKTGDLGYLDKDGYLYITGRKKNVIVLESGENVSPEELEHQLQSFSIVEDVMVSEKEGRIFAEIIPLMSDGKNMESIKDEIEEAINEVNRENPLYKRISKWEIRNTTFEKTASMKKIRKHVEYSKE